MSDIKSWSATAASNNSASPDGFKEGMAPSGLNDSSREVMAAVRRALEEVEWFDFGDTITYASTTQFTVPGDLTARYHVGRRLRVVGSLTGTIYGTISTSSFSTNTTVTITLDSGTLNNETLAASLGAPSATDKSISYLAIHDLISANISYDNSTSGLTATDIKAALDEIWNDLVTNGNLAANAQVSADQAAVSESNAATSETNASNSETAAGNAQTAAEAAQTAAEAVYDDFDDRYLGEKASDPTLDNDGEALVSGVMYFKTGEGFRGYNGSSWGSLPATTASAIANVATGNITATDVQAAINELDDIKTNKDEVAYDDDGADFIPNTLSSGAILEKGSNSNGEYTKFADGTMICRFVSASLSTTSTTMTTPIKRSAGQTFTYPVAFIGTPHVSPNCVYVSAAYSWGAASSVNASTVTIFIISSSASSTAYGGYIAIGRWKA